MSLKNFHIFFITLSVLMLLGGGWMAYASYRVEPAHDLLVTALACVFAALYLMVYGYSFLRKTRKMTA
jgi:uncharacterized membrane protein SirB2